MPTSPDTAPRPLGRPASLKDAAYGQIKNLLITGQLEHDKLYSAQFFADMLGVSRTPVREALLQLTNEGFLVCFDVRGFKIKEFSPKDVADVFETRQIIETYLIRRLADTLPADDLRHMEQTLKVMRDCAARGDSLGFLDADKEFHMIPLRRSGNLHLLSIMEHVRGYMSILSLRALGRPGRSQQVLREHAAIIKALRARDPKQAVRAMRHHLAKTAEHWLTPREAAAE